MNLVCVAFALLRSSLLGEKLLCFHGPLLYEAKVTFDCIYPFFLVHNAVGTKSQFSFHRDRSLHFNNSWDEWVTDKRIFKYNEEGLRKQKELEQQIKSGKKVKILRKSDLKKQSYPPPEIMEEIEQTLRPVENKQQEVNQPEPKVKVKPSDELSSLSEQPKQSTNTTPPPEPAPISSNKPSEPPKPPLQEEHVPPASHTPVSNRRRKGRTGPHDGSIENEEGFLTAPQLKVDLPSSLKAWLVDDWDLITRQARTHTQLRSFFPVVIHLHLPLPLVCLVKLREMVSCTRVDPSGLPVLETLVNEFLEFLRAKQKTYFRLENYTVATAEYQRRAMC
ncbi:hypothetical protein X801_04078 [Opisthorchis viverrini]|uniref:MRG domain-containing protein n=1 Tax=Opisthorchis viverrini TaxID=6198 RepID=A0A1S8X050_OPIVI|nr:hypothetical protein X801_04078 [Opisthorchis viverrini]